MSVVDFDKMLLDLLREEEHLLGRLEQIRATKKYIVASRIQPEPVVDLTCHESLSPDSDTMNLDFLSVPPDLGG